MLGMGGTLSREVDSNGSVVGRDEAGTQQHGSQMALSMGGQFAGAWDEMFTSAVRTFNSKCVSAARSMPESVPLGGPHGLPKGGPGLVR